MRENSQGPWKNKMRENSQGPWKNKMRENSQSPWKNKMRENSEKSSASSSVNLSQNKLFVIPDNHVLKQMNIKVKIYDYLKFLQIYWES
jgi:hypothetical protein